MRALVAGWFSFESMGATAGDLLARDLVRRWLAEAEVPNDVAVAPPFASGVDWRGVDPSRYSHLVFVCGPFGNGYPVDGLLQRFASCRLIGIDLTMIDPIEAWNPFDFLLERDSSRTVRPDIAFASRTPKVPVVGVVLVQRQREYGDRARHDLAHAAIERLLAAREVARCVIDTRLDTNGVGLRTAAEIESLVARMNVVVTTRLHGLVLALKNGVPALAVDAIAGGAKLRRQAEAVGWPAVIGLDELNDATVARAFDWCLSVEARVKARRCRDYAVARVEETRSELLRAFSRDAER